METCRAALENGILTLENDRIRRVYAWTVSNSTTSLRWTGTLQVHCPARSHLPCNSTGLVGHASQVL